jgi:hypothetical protein
LDLRQDFAEEFLEQLEAIGGGEAPPPSAPHVDPYDSKASADNVLFVIMF